MIEDFKTGVVIFSEVKRNHYKVTGRFLKQASGLKYITCRQWLPIKKQWGKSIVFTERNLEDYHFKISTRDFS